MKSEPLSVTEWHIPSLVDAFQTTWLNEIKFNEPFINYESLRKMTSRSAKARLVEVVVIDFIIPLLNALVTEVLT